VSWFQRLRGSLGKARDTFAAVQNLGRARKPLTDEFWEDLEELLIMGDFGVPTTAKIIEGLKTVAKQEAWATTDQAVTRFHRDVERFLTLPNAELNLSAEPPSVVLVVGVNGSGKTTTIGKLATRLQHEGKRVLLVAGDTFRAAAAEQLAIWADRSKSDIVRGAEGSPPPPPPPPPPIPHQ
jgi:fused signal recognition particle receptor